MINLSVNLIYLGASRATCTRAASRRGRSTAAASTSPPSAASLRVSGWMEDVQLCIYTYLPTFVRNTYLPTHPPTYLSTYLPVCI